MRKRYLGVSDRHFEQLRPYRQKLFDMMLSCFPQTPEYKAISEAMHSLDRAAEVGTGKPHFYGKVLDTGCIGGGPKE
jgi:hypothetical protein